VAARREDQAAGERKLPLARAADALNDMMNRKVQGKVVLTTG